MFKQVIFFSVVLCVVAFNTASGAEPVTSVPASLDEAKTSAEIMAYAGHR